MNVNNQCFRMFKEMKEGYANNDFNQMEHGARCWLELNPSNPFADDTPEMEAFFQMQKCYMIWKRGDIDRKINRRRMISWAEKLCALNPRQPYKFDKKAEEEELLKQKQEEEKKVETKIEEPIIEKTTIKVEEPQTVLGIVPEKKSWFKNFLSRLKEGDSYDRSGSD